MVIIAAQSGRFEENRMFRLTNLLAVAAFVVGSASAGHAASFNSVVETVLMQQKRIKELDADRQGQMIACVKKTLAVVPAERQSYVAAATDFDEMEERFGEVVLANQAEFEKLITRECGGIAIKN
jgi:hypothetical protein